MRTKFYAEIHVPKNSADGYWVIRKDGHVVATIDPEGAYFDASSVAEKIAEALNEYHEEIV